MAMQAKVHYQADKCCLFWASLAFVPSDYDDKYRIGLVSTRWDAGVEVGPRQYIAEPEFGDVINRARVKL